MSRQAEESSQTEKEITERVFGGIDKVTTEEKRSYIKALVSKAIPEEKKNVFNQCLEEENKLISKMGEGFVEKIKYIKRVSQRDLEHVGKGEINSSDPKIHFFQQCRDDLDLALPILDKVFKKTLMLSEYTLSEGHARGLARACQFFDHQYVNRVFFSNCGISDSEFSEILKGLRDIKDFKSIIYKMNAFNELSVQNLRPLLLKRLPNHLEEIKLIDCQMNGSHISSLIDLLLETDC